MTDGEADRGTIGRVSIRDRHDPNAAASWDAVYVEDTAPWDIGRPQSAFVGLADADEIASPVLDSGCGTGEHALMLAARGVEVMGVDLSPTAIARARQKAADRGLTATFQVGDVLALDRLDRTFATIVDNGAFHVFDDEDRARYVCSLAAAAGEGTVLHLMCFSEREPGTFGPRRITQEELRESFADGWQVERIEAAVIEVRPDWEHGPAQAWLARIVRTDGGRP